MTEYLEGYGETRHHHRGRFWHGFLFSVIGWALATTTATLLYSLIQTHYGPGKPFTINTEMLEPFALFLGAVWLPLAVFAGVRSRRSGFKASMSLMFATCFVAPLVIACGFAALIAKLQ